MGIVLHINKEVSTFAVTGTSNRSFSYKEQEKEEEEQEKQVKFTEIRVSHYSGASLYSASESYSASSFLIWELYGFPQQCRTIVVM